MRAVSVLALLAATHACAAALPVIDHNPVPISPLNALGSLSAEEGEDFKGDGTGHDGWDSEHNFGGATGKPPVTKEDAAETIGKPLEDQVERNGQRIDGPTKMQDLHERIQELAKKLAPPGATVVDKELGELHALLGNYKHVHESVAKLHSQIRHELDYKPDGMPLKASTPEDRVLRELRRTAEVVREHTKRADRTVGVPTIHTGHHPEPESLDPAAIMRKHAYENLPVEGEQKDVKDAPQLTESTPEPTLAPTPTPAHVKSIYELQSSSEDINPDTDANPEGDADEALPANDGLLGTKQ